MKNIPGFVKLTKTWNKKVHKIETFFVRPEEIVEFSNFQVKLLSCFELVGVKERDYVIGKRIRIAKRESEEK